MQVLPRMHAREYTIASSSKVSPTRVHIAVSVVQEPVGFGPPGTLFRGVCSNHLARSLPLERTSGYRRTKEEKELNEEGHFEKWPMLWVGIRKSTFILPTDPAVPLILIGPGTGVAPMRAFLQERRWQRLQGLNPGQTHLYFGCRRRDEDFIYEVEILDYCASGDVTTFQPAFSREGLAKVYVQHRVLEDGENVWRMVQDHGAYIFVCGGAQMGRDVMTALHEVAMHHGSMSEAEAQKVFAQMHSDGRLVQELWS
jgi:NADPH-ferrihemoprotein reductase